MGKKGVLYRSYSLEEKSYQFGAEQKEGLD